jgi:hypothetical protein
LGPRRRVTNAIAEDGGLHSGALGEGVVEAPAGPVVMLDNPGEDHRIREWLDLVAAHLTSQGWDGQLTAPRRVSLPSWTRPLIDE